MTVARLKGKVGASEPDHLEDLLTSDVLAALRYLPVDVGVGPVLDLGRDDEGRAFADWRRERGVEWSDAIARISFWPQLETREPDALVRLWDADPVHPELAVLIEAKLHSDQHEIDSLSQLGWYTWRHLAGAWSPELAVPSADRRAAVFLTAHRDMPVDAIRVARAEAAGRMQLATRDVRIFWLGWRDIARLVERQWSALAHHAPRQPWLRHLLDMRDHLALRGLGGDVFEGVRSPPTVAERPWWRASAAPSACAVGVMGRVIASPPTIPPKLGVFE